MADLYLKVTPINKLRRRKLRLNRLGNMPWIPSPAGKARHRIGTYTLNRENRAVPLITTPICIDQRHSITRYKWSCWHWPRQCGFTAASSQTPSYPWPRIHCRLGNSLFSFLLELILFPWRQPRECSHFTDEAVGPDRRSSGLWHTIN